MKRIIIVLNLLLPVLSAMAQGFTYSYNGVEFKGKISHGKACIKSFDSKAPEVTIPAVITYKAENYPVKSVSTFMNGVNYSTVNLVIEEGVEEIDKFCFNEFRKLQSVLIPSTVRHVGKNAFRDNAGMSFLIASAQIEESSLRHGHEIWVKDGDDKSLFAAAKEKVSSLSSSVVSVVKEKTARHGDDDKSANDVRKDKESEEAARLKAQLKEQEKLLKQQQELLAQAAKDKEKEQEKERKRKEKEEKAKKNNGESGGVKGMLGGLFGGRRGKADKEKSAPVQSQQQPQSQPELMATASVAQVRPELPPVDVDMDIPMVKTDKNANTYCIIIANEKYEDVPEVEYAERDGNVFKEYCIKTLGIPEKQVRTFINASYTDIKRALNWIETMADISGGNSKILFYYAGHGIPNEKDKTAYLIPTDGFPKDITTCFKLSDMYARLGKIKTQSVTVLLDACFSGVKRGSGQALVTARGVAIKPKNEVLSGNMVVFTAASDDETALAYKDKRHGMFTYFLLDHLKKTEGKSSFGELFKTLSSEVKKNSMLENDKLQTPSVNVSASMKAKWEKMQF